MRIYETEGRDLRAKRHVGLRWSLLVASIIFLAPTPPNSVNIDNAQLTCDAKIDVCHGSNVELDVGTVWTYEASDQSATRVADAHHDTYDCGNVQQIQMVDGVEELVIYVGKEDHHGRRQVGLTHAGRLLVYEYGSSDCTGIATGSFVDEETVKVPYITNTLSGSASCAAEGYADCAGGYSDPAATNELACSRLDLLLERPAGSPTSTSYKVYVYASLSGLTYDTGCINVTW